MISLSAKKLRTLPVGEKFVYYRGWLADDIRRCEPREGEKPFYVHDRKFPPGAPSYGRMLQDLYFTAQGLAAVGIIELNEKIIAQQGRFDKKNQWLPAFKITEYSAIGIQPPIEDKALLRAIRRPTEVTKP